MARRPRAAAPTEHQLHDRLGELACAVAADFLLDPDGMADYRKSRTPSAMKRAAKRAAPVALDIFDMHGGKIMLFPTLEEWGFIVLLDHDAFRASVAIHYDPTNDDPAPTAVQNFEGDSTKAYRVLREWIDEVETEDDDDLDQDDMPSMNDLIDMLSTMMDAPRGQPGGPAGAGRIKANAARAAAKYRRDGRFAPTQADAKWMEAHTDCLDPILDSYVAACAAPKRDDALIEVHRHLLVMQLEFIRYQVERDWDWAKELVAAYEKRILALADGKALSPHDWYPLPMTFNQARLPVSEATARAFGEAGGAITDPVESGDLPGMMREIVEEMAKEIDDPFAIAAVVTETTGPLPPDARVYVATELALASNQVARDAVPLLLLDPAVEVRRAAVAALEQTAGPEALSPMSLRRMIAVRTWMPADERPSLDRAIRKAREKGVTIAPWPAAGEIAYLASMIDGVDAQSVMAYSPKGAKGTMAFLLLKRGVKDSGFDAETPRRAIKLNVQTVREDARGAEVDRAYFDLSVGHAIATGLTKGELPPLGLLHIAEAIGATDWREQALDVTAEIAGLLATLTDAERTEPAIAASLARSGKWTADGDVFDTWYEDGKEVHDLIGRLSRAKAAGAVGMVLDNILEPLRGLWTERLLLMALWARAAKDKAQHGRWKDYLILAHALLDGRKLADIPLVRASAQLSVNVIRGGR